MKHRLTAVLTAVLLMLQLAVTPLAALARTGAPAPKADIQTITLPTGQTLYVKEMQDQPIVTIDTWVKTGSVNENEAINGVSHFLEHLLFKGTETHQAGDFERLLESKGATFNAATSADFTHYYITIASQHLEKAVKLHADMLLNATIPKDELARERKVVQEEINRALDNPDRQVYIALSEALYGDHGYGLDTLGPKEVIAGIPRQDILEYYHYWYQPKNFNTVIVGDVDVERVRELVTKYFPAPGYARPKQYEAPAPARPVPPEDPVVQVKTDPTISQTYLTLGMLGPSVEDEDDMLALDVAFLALGGGKSSRLYQKLKEERNLVTSISAGNMTRRDSGLLYVDARMKPENLAEVKRAVVDELQLLVAEGVTPDELEKAKTQYLKDFIFLNESTGGVANSIGYNVTIGDLEDYTDYVADLQKVTQSDVKRALQEYIRFDQAVLVEMMPESAAESITAEERQTLALLNEAAAETVAVAEAGVANEATAAEKKPVVQKKVLPNGMTVLFKPVETSETVAFKIFVKGGQSVEKIPGVATLTSRMMMQGTRNRTAAEISKELEKRGMSLSVSATDDYLEIAGHAIKDDLGELFLIVDDVLNHPMFDEAEIAKQKEQIRQSIRAGRDNPSAVAFENLALAMYPEHPYGYVGKRIEENLDRISREDIVRYYRTNVAPRRMTTVVVGNFDPAVVSNYINMVFPHRPAPQVETARLSVPDLPVPDLKEDVIVREEKPDQAATWIAQGWLAPPVENEKDYVTLKVINSLLGSGMSSRLFRNLREKQGLAYVVSSFYPSRRDTSHFVMYIGTDPANRETVKSGFEREINRLMSERVSAQELEEAKDKLAGSFALAHETNASQAFYLGLYETLGVGYEFDETYPDLIQQVTADDVNRVARAYFSEPMVFSIVEPASVAADKGRETSPSAR